MPRLLGLRGGQPQGVTTAEQRELARADGGWLGPTKPSPLMT